MSNKTELNNLCQKRFGVLPNYLTYRSADPGEPHTPNFDSTLVLPNNKKFSVKSFQGSKKETESNVARQALDYFADQDLLKAEEVPPRGRHQSACSGEKADFRTVCIARVTKQHPNSVEAASSTVRGKIRVAGDMAKDILPGMLIEVRVRSPETPSSRK